MRVRFSRRALADLEMNADYLSRENPGSAGRVRDSLLEGCALAARFPSAGRQQSVSGVRRLVTRRFGYSIYYLPDRETGTLAILSIRHPRRAPGMES